MAPNRLAATRHCARNTENVIFNNFKAGKEIFKYQWHLPFSNPEILIKWILKFQSTLSAIIICMILNFIVNLKCV